MMKLINIAAVSFLAFTANQTYALEAGKSIYSHGAENYMVGVIPPTGFAGLLYGMHYSSDRLNDSNGDRVNIPNFKVEATGIVPRFVWVSDNKILGGNFILDSLVPLVHLKATAGNENVSESGIGDIMIGTALGYHHSPNLHSALALDFYLPTGDYDQNKIANIGTNRLTIEPAYAVTYINDKFNADIRVGYLYNGKNDDTNYESGDEFHFDYALGLNHKNITYGISGYYQKQIKNDRLNNFELNNSKTEGLSIGPSFKYQYQNWFITAKYEKEIMSKNRTEGDAFWIKTVLQF
jgi:hypothetical protein